MKRLLLALIVSCLSPFAIHLSPLQAFVNPILPYDYSDPDVIRLGKYYYMTYSTFACTPGLQILRSEDAVHWEYADAALPDTIPGYGHLDGCPAGCGVWAPSLRFNQGRFYIYYGDPDIGIFCIRSAPAESIPCAWEPAVLVKAGKGLIDPCPLWDEKGHCYLVHAYAGSRAGIKSLLAVCELSKDGLSVIKDDEIVFDGHPDNSTCEGPKFYKRNAYYYIFCPAGGVKTGWQLCLRSKSPYGPYEVQRVLEQDTTDVNGPHQGAWFEDWFWHFQDVGAAGRIVHLQPLKWRKGWPVIGDEGRPMRVVEDWYIKDDGKRVVPARDEFDTRFLAPEWQWSGNKKPVCFYCNIDSSYLRLFTYPADTVQTATNLLLRKIPANTTFTFDARVRFTPNPKNAENEEAGLIVHGRKSKTLPIPKDGQWWYVRVIMDREQRCKFFISSDGRSWDLVDESFRAVAGEWIGAKVGFYAIRNRQPINDSGYMDIDWMTLTPSPSER
jgi:beta-xylosidase